MVTCGALNCGNSSTKKSVADVKGWHNVPTEKENKQRRKKWLAAMKRDPPYPADTNFVLCGMHFTSECFQRDLKAELCGSVRKFILLPNAIPSVFSFSKPLPAKRSASIARNERKTKRQIVDEACTAEENSGGPEAPSLELEPLFKDAITQTVDVVMINKEVSCATPMRTKSTMVPAVLCKSMSTQMSPTLSSTNTQTVILTQYASVSTVNLIAKEGDEIGDCSSFCASEVEDRADPDASFNVSSDVDTVDSSADTADSDVNEQDVDVREGTQSIAPSTMFLVYFEMLKSLFKFCFECGEKATIKKHITKGSMLIVKLVCAGNHEVTWRSQPYLNRIAEGTVRLSAGILFNGLTFQGVKEAFETANVNFISRSQFHELQRRFLFPAINSIFTHYQEATLVRLVALEGVDLIGDGRCDSPGFSAKYGTYSLMDAMTNEVVNFFISHVRLAGNSARMEKHGLAECLEFIDEAGVIVDTLVTDRHSQIRKFMRTEHEHISHQFDVWHMTKNIKKKILKVAKKKSCRDLNDWMKSIINHFWWACSTCEGDPILLKEKWQSLLCHIRGVHYWVNNTLYHKCAHEELTLLQQAQKKWLTEESPAYIALEKIVNEKQLLNDLKHVADFKHTGQLEVYHSLLNKYCPKRLTFSYAGMVARTQLAVLDHNSGVERQQATTSDGRLKFKVSFTKITKEWVAKKVMDPKEKKYQEDLMKEVFDLVQKIKAPIFFKLPETPRNIALKINPGKEVVVSNMRSRFT
ncbi:uncharacterized protein LOC130662674 [Hydractinia symbiolongicarpus]|uniref:uncharacterized protein LOC130662674 n=1 Tax=Hydractinia symbiolongicarpus TaxID=13093 RepID=UPI00254E96E0|nr:uncharacterized protein LOC130662674 [Hydractinia symbiolongicarpus]